MVKIKRAMALLLMTILIFNNSDYTYAAEDIDSVVSGASEESKLVDIVDEEPALAGTLPDEQFETDDDSLEITDYDEEFSEESESDKEELMEDVISQNETVSFGKSLISDRVLFSLSGGMMPAGRPGAGITYDVCFYIRGNKIGAEIPEEPCVGLYWDYSEGIRVNGAVSQSKLRFSEKEADGVQDELIPDGFTAANEVTAILDKVPSATDIQGLIPDFDPEQHYVVWYVIKEASTYGEDADVTIHVDGVIRQRVLQEEPAEVVPEEPQEEPYLTTGDPKHDKRLDEIEATISSINIVPQFYDENGTHISEIEYDGEMHLVGGFDIVVVDSKRNPLAEFMHDLWGQLLFSKVYAEYDHTSFEYKGETFFVNVTSARIEVIDKLPGKIQFYSGKEEISSDDVVVTDERGKKLKSGVVDAPGSVSGSGTNKEINLKRRKLTIEAGTTVKNDDGSTLTNDTFEIIEGSLVKGHRIESVVFNGSQTGVGYCANHISSVTIVDANGKDVTKNYDINPVDGKLQLVDGSKKSFGNARAAASSNINTNDAVESTSIANNSKSFGTVFKAKVTHADGSVTYINVPFETSAGLDLSDNVPQVLGARRAATGDDRIPLLRYMIILICIGLISAPFKKQNKLTPLPEAKKIRRNNLFSY